jgi:Fe-S-cluster-containing dehydrogenase component
MRVRQFELIRQDERGQSSVQPLNLPMNCLNCDEPACRKVCPTGAISKRAADGIVIIDADACTGCGQCALACPYGVCELDSASGTMVKCNTCVGAAQFYGPATTACAQACPTQAIALGDFDDPNSAVSQSTLRRSGRALLAERGYKPTSRYLMPRVRETGPLDGVEAAGPALRELVQVLMDRSATL